MSAPTRARSRRDSVLRAITDDGSFRLIVARTDLTARAASAAQNAAGDTARRFAELLTGAVLYRETMAPQLRVQCIIDDRASGGRLVADSFPDGDNRGLVVLPDGGDEVVLGADAVLRMTRALPRGRLHEGVVQVPQGGDISAALMTYLQESEQVVSVTAVGAVGDGDELRAGGYLVQLLPEVERAMLAVMTERLAAFRGITALLAGDPTPQALVEEVFHRMPHTKLEESEVRFSCRCGRARAARALATAGRSEVLLALKDGRALTTTCEFCHTVYRFEVAELAELAQTSKASAQVH